MKDVWFALNWMGGVIFLMLGLVSLIDSPLVALPLFIAALLLLPPFRNFVYSKTQIQLPFAARALSIVVLLIVFGTIVGENQEKKMQETEVDKASKQAEKSDPTREEKINHFGDNRERILADIELAISSGEYDKAMSLSAKYITYGDPEISKLYRQAKRSLSELRKADKTNKILAELRTIPETEYETNRNLYQKLTALYPENENYKSKVNHYHAKLIEERKQEQLASERPRGIGITRDSLMRAVHAWNPYLEFIPVEQEEGVAALNGNTVIGLAGPEQDVTIVVVAIRINSNDAYTALGGIDLVMISDAVFDGSSVWIEEMVDLAIASPKNQIEESRVFGNKLYEFVYVLEGQNASIGLVIQNTNK